MNALLTQAGTPSPVTQATPGPRRDRAVVVAAALLWLAAAAAAASAVTAIGVVADADAATRMVETWRALGYAVFAGLFGLLAWRPRANLAVWIVVLADKAALTGLAVLYADRGMADGTGPILVWDGGLTVTLLVALVLARPWTSGRRH